MMTQTLPTGSRSLQPSRPALSVESLPLQTFAWGAGVECSSLPHLGVDQFTWTQHNRYWKEDLTQAREELGISYLRYAFPWHALEPQPGQFDWTMADERVAHMQKLGLEPVLDVMHFGTPLWLKQAAGDPMFPESLERMTAAMVRRYRGAVRIWCPCNEPLVLALFSGDFGFWPPHARKWRGYMPVLSRIVEAVSRSIRAVREANPEATVLLCDAAENYKTRHESLASEVQRRNMRRFLVMDLLTGRVDRSHPMFNWLSGYGMSDIDLEWFGLNPQTPDILGLDYYSHSDWQLDQVGGSVRQRRAESPVGLYGIGNAYYQRYGLPLMLTETSIEGQSINREIWFESTVEEARRLRGEGVPLLGYFWWPLLDQLDWDGALTHRIGKIHEVGLYRLSRQADGSLARTATPLVKMYREAVEAGEKRIGKLERIAQPAEMDEEQGPPIGEQAQPVLLVSPPAGNGKNGNGNGNGNGGSSAVLDQPTGQRTVRSDPAPGLAAEPLAAPSGTAAEGTESTQATGPYGIVVFSHLRWGFVWQRPQQFLSRFARKHKVLFMEEPLFDLREGEEPRISMHRVMHNVAVACPHMPPSWNRSRALPAKLRELLREAMEGANDSGEFDRPLLWYYSPMDSAWSLGQVPNRGIVYDSMDELSQFTGAPRSLVENEKRLMRHADIVFAGGYELSLKKKEHHPNVHFFGCGVEVEHFGKAMDPNTVIPPDIDFMARPILGWFGVVDERVDYALVHEVAKLRPEWSVAMVGPVVKIDPNLLPHAPNLFWLGQRDYQVLPNYCRAFDVCIMPFAINAATQYINPTKVLEYFATGRPVISTPVKDVVRQYSDTVSIVRTAEEFVAAAEQLLAHPDAQRQQRAMEMARNGGWEATVNKMRQLIADAIGSDARPSAQRIEPLGEWEEAPLSYQYQPTPGS